MYIYGLMKVSWNRISWKMLKRKVWWSHLSDTKTFTYTHAYSLNYNNSWKIPMKNDKFKRQ